MHHRIRTVRVTVGDPKEMALLARLKQRDHNGREHS
jgi:hypothetical protein